MKSFLTVTSATSLWLDCTQHHQSSSMAQASTQREVKMEWIIAFILYSTAVTFILAFMMGASRKEKEME